MLNQERHKRLDLVGSFYLRAARRRRRGFICALASAACHSSAANQDCNTEMDHVLEKTLGTRRGAVALAMNDRGRTAVLDLAHPACRVFHL